MEDSALERLLAVFDQQRKAFRRFETALNNCVQSLTVVPAALKDEEGLRSVETSNNEPPEVFEDVEDEVKEKFSRNSSSEIDISRDKICFEIGSIGIKAIQIQEEEQQDEEQNDEVIFVKKENLPAAEFDFKIEHQDEEQEVEEPKDEYKAEEESDSNTPVEIDSNRSKIEFKIGSIFIKISDSATNFTDLTESEKVTESAPIYGSVEEEQEDEATFIDERFDSNLPSAIDSSATEIDSSVEVYSNRDESSSKRDSIFINSTNSEAILADFVAINTGGSNVDVSSPKSVATKENRRFSINQVRAMSPNSDIKVTSSPAGYGSESWLSKGLAVPFPSAIPATDFLAMAMASQVVGSNQGGSLNCCMNMVKGLVFGHRGGLKDISTKGTIMVFLLL